MVALIACAFASRQYERAPGENVYVGVFGPTRAQAAITYRYIRGLFRSVPQLEGLIVSEKANSLELSNHVVIEVITATVASPRGRAYALAIIEEAAFLPNDHAANPDVELLRAVRPALARVPGSLLCVVSSPYARRGVIWNAWKRHHDQPDGDVVLVQSPTLELNPTFDRRAIETAYAEDEAAARAEYGAEFRKDVESFVSMDAIEACVIQGRREAFRRHGILYEPSSKSKSDLYRDTLALLNAGRVELLDDDRLVTQLVGLERRTARGGRDSIDHAPGQHDDLANVVAGLAVGLAVHRLKNTSLIWGRDRSSGKPSDRRQQRETIMSRRDFARQMESQQHNRPILIEVGTKPK